MLSFLSSSAAETVSLHYRQRVNTFQKVTVKTANFLLFFQVQNCESCGVSLRVIRNYIFDLNPLNITVHLPSNYDCNIDNISISCVLPSYLWKQVLPSSRCPRSWQQPIQIQMDWMPEEERLAGHPVI